MATNKKIDGTSAPHIIVASFNPFRLVKRDTMRIMAGQEGGKRCVVRDHGNPPFFANY
jgi:hypothetical protein